MQTIGLNSDHRNQVATILNTPKSTTDQYHVPGIVSERSIT